MALFERISILHSGSTDRTPYNTQKTPAVYKMHQQQTGKPMMMMMMNPMMVALMMMHFAGVAQDRCGHIQFYASAKF